MDVNAEYHEDILNLLIVQHVLLFLLFDFDEYTLLIKLDNLVNEIK